MSTGASNIDFVNHPLLRALADSNRWNDTFTYYFAVDGEDVNKGGYAGGSDFTRAWTNAEKDAFRAVTDRYSEVAQVTFSETSTLAGASFNLQMVDDVPGGWAGYAGGRTFVVGSANTSLLTHELGHSLGLDHPFNGGYTLPGVTDSYDVGDFGFNAEYYTVMAYRRGTFGDYPDLRLANPDSLGVLDVAALQALYGANTTHNNGDDTYGLTNKIVTIWDTDGQDVIDFSGATTNTIIDLRAATLEVEEGGLGRPSIIDADDGGRQGAYSIAYGVIVEDGIGGEGADNITGNIYANSLSGGLGNDTITGGGGHDTLVGNAEGAEIDSVSMVTMDGGSALRLDNYDQMPGDVTIDMVLRFEEGVEHFQRILSYAPDDTADVGLELQLWEADYPWLYVITRNGNSLSTHSTGITRAELMDGEIHRLTLTREADTGRINLYLDGVYQGGGNHRAGEALPAGGSLVFGQSQGTWGAANSPNHAFKGEMGPIAVYDGVFDDIDIAARSASNLADTSNPNLISYWTPQNGASFADATGGAALTADDTGAVRTVDLNSDDDILRGQSGHDTLIGGIGADTLIGGSGTDTLFGGTGNDEYRFAFDYDATDILSEAGAGGRDRVVITDRTVLDLDFARDGNDLLITQGAGEIRVTDLYAGPGSGRIEELQDTDQLYLLRPGETGSNRADILVADADGSNLSGGDGNDMIIGGDGHDVLAGGAGADHMAGGLGNDFYIVDNAGDVITNETVFSAGGGIDTVRSFIDYVQPDNIELVRLGTVAGTAALNATGNDAPGTLVGNAGHNTLTGRGGNDQLNGNGGNDVITGNTGRDTLVGGAGNDTFVYTAYADSRAGGAARDVINGFTRGADRIDLRDLDANTLSFGVDQAFSFIGFAGFTAAGQLRLQNLGGPNAVLVEADHNGDGLADLQIFVNLTSTLSAGDFLL